jgi:hypothetical protein
VALPEPEGAPDPDRGEEVVAPVEAATPVRLVGRLGGPAGPVPAGWSPVVRVAA